MSRWSLAFKSFFRVFKDAAFANRVEQLLRGESLESSAPPAQRVDPKATVRSEPKPARSDALTLLAALQREARFVDLVQEPLDNYADAQIGAAARDVLRDCRSVLQRLFGLQPLLAQEEGSVVNIPLGFDASQFRLTGSVSGDPPFQGRLRHHGWQAAQCQLPVWTGTQDATRVIAAAEVEVGV